jgi:hypothetical protein
MRRRFAAVDLVRLPRLDAVAAQTLGTEVVSNARAILADKGAAKKIPEGVVEALDDVALALSALNQAAASRLPLAAPADPQRTKLADIALDGVWGGLLDVINGWSKMPGLPEAEIAASLGAMLFPEGLKFTQLAYKLQWAESNTRILVIEEQKLEPQLKKLGAEKILEKLYEAHKEYGEAQGITAPAEVVVEETTTVREAFDELMEALRVFIVRATGMVSKKDPTKGDIAEQLLAPIMAWETPGARGKGAEPPAAEPPAAQPAADQPADQPAAPPAPAAQPSPQ